MDCASTASVADHGHSYESRARLIYPSDQVRPMRQCQWGDQRNRAQPLRSAHGHASQGRRGRSPKSSSGIKYNSWHVACPSVTLTRYGHPTLTQ